MDNSQEPDTGTSGQSNRRRFLSSVAGVTTLALTGQSTAAAPKNTNPRDYTGQPFYTVTVALTTFSREEDGFKEDHSEEIESMLSPRKSGSGNIPFSLPESNPKPVVPYEKHINVQPEYYDEDDTAERIVFPYYREKHEAFGHDEEIYRTRFGFLIQVSVFGEPEDAEKITVHLNPTEHAEYGEEQILDSRGASVRFDVDEILATDNNTITLPSSEIANDDSSSLLGSAVDTARDFVSEGDGAESPHIKVDFAPLDFGTDAQTLRPFYLDVSTKVWDSGGNVIREDPADDRGEMKLASLGSDADLDKTLENASLVTQTGIAAFDSLVTAPVDEMYKSAKMASAVSSDTQTDPLSRRAVVYDMSAFSPSMNTNYAVLKNKAGTPVRGELRMMGMSVGGELQDGESATVDPSEPPEPDVNNGSAEPEQTDTDPETDSKSQTDISSEISGLDFTIKPVSRTELTCKYKTTGESDYPVEDFKVAIDTDGVNREYALTDITSETTFEPGDEYRLDQDTLGLNSELQLNGGVFTLFYVGDDDPLMLVETSGITFDS